MVATFAAQGVNEDSLSTAVPLWTKSASHESHDLALSTSRLTFTDHWRDHGSSIALRTADGQSRMKSSEIPRHMQTTKISPSTSYLDNPSLTTDHLELDSIGKMSVREPRISPAKNIILRLRVQRPRSRLTSQTTMKRETADSALPLNSKNITTNAPLRGDSIVRSKQPLYVSQEHISEDAQKTLIRHNDVVTRDIAHDSTSYKPTVNLQLSEAHQSSVSTVLQNFSAVAAKVQSLSHETTAEVVRGWFSTAQETTLQSSVAPTSSTGAVSTQNISLHLGVVSQFMSQRTVKMDTEDSSMLLNLRNITTKMPLKGDSVVHSNQPLHVSQMHISEVTQKTSSLFDDAVTRDVGHDSTSYKPTVNFHLSEAAHNSSLPSILQDVLTVPGKMQTLSHESDAEVVRGRFSLSWLQSTTAQEATSQSSVAPVSSTGDVSAQNISLPVGIVSQSTSQRTVKQEAEDSSLLLNSVKITTDMPLRGDSVMHSHQPLRVSHMPVSEDAQKTSVLPDVLQTLPTVAARVQTLSRKSSEEVASGRFSSLLPQFTATQETTSESSVATTSSAGNVAETFHSGEYC